MLVGELLAQVAAFILLRPQVLNTHSKWSEQKPGSCFGDSVPTGSKELSVSSNSSLEFSRTGSDRITSLPDRNNNVRPPKMKAKTDKLTAQRNSFFGKSMKHLVGEETRRSPEKQPLAAPRPFSASSRTARPDSSDGSVGVLGGMLESVQRPMTPDDLATGQRVLADSENNSVALVQRLKHERSLQRNKLQARMAKRQAARGIKKRAERPPSSLDDEELVFIFKNEEKGRKLIEEDAAAHRAIMTAHAEAERRQKALNVANSLAQSQRLADMRRERNEQRRGNTPQSRRAAQNASAADDDDEEIIFNTV
jgi:hypothetical protein